MPSVAGGGESGGFGGHDRLTVNGKRVNVTNTYYILYYNMLYKGTSYTFAAMTHDLRPGVHNT